MSYENYHVVLAVGAFILDDKKRLLIVKKSQHERIDAGLWVVPGGKIKPDEHIIKGLFREVKEEVNLKIIKWQWTNEDVFIVENIYFHAAHFICKVKSTKNIKLEKNLTEYKWVTKRDLKNYKMPKNLKREALQTFTSF